MPLTLQHLESLAYLKDETFQYNIVEKNRLISEQAVAPVGYFEWDCDVATERDDFVAELMKHVRVDAHGHCLNNQKKVLNEDSKDLYEVMGRYKFVLVFEKAVCRDYIGRRLWQALHVGAVPIYFGAENVDAWMPNPMSVIKLAEIKNPKSLADYLILLHKDESMYSGFLKHKPSYNENYFTLLTNTQLLKFNLNENYLDRFECVVCERVAKNEKIIKLGFKGYPYHSNENKLSCPAPKSILSSLGLKHRKDSGIWQRKWIRSKYESDAIRKFDLYGANFTRAAYEVEILKLGRHDKIPMDQFLS